MNCDAVSRPSQLLDHFVGGGEKLRVKFEAHGFGGLEIDDELELAGLKDRHVGRLVTFENSPDVDPSLAKGIRKARSVTHQAASSGKLNGRSKSATMAGARSH
jgi:hypothetical protein